MLRLFYPGAYVTSVFCIDYQALWDRGCRGLLFDIDNTLVPHGDDSTPEINALFRRLHAMGFRTLMLSNNGEARIRRFLQDIDARFLSNAGKPRPKGYRRAVEMLGLSKDEVLVIGDQVFTDVLGANLAGLGSILVRFIGWETETDLGKRRRLEQVILRRYEKKYPAGRLGRVWIEENNHAMEQEQALL